MTDKPDGKRVTTFIACALLCGAFCGCGERPINSMTLYSLIENERPGHNMKEAFHGCLVLGKTDVASADDRLAIIDHLQGINRSLLNRLRPMALGHVPLAELLSEVVRERARQHPDLKIV